MSGGLVWKKLFEVYRGNPKKHGEMLIYISENESHTKTLTSIVDNDREFRSFLQNLEGKASGAIENILVPRILDESKIVRADHAKGYQMPGNSTAVGVPGNSTVLGAVAGTVSSNLEAQLFKVMANTINEAIESRCWGWVAKPLLVSDEWVANKVGKDVKYGRGQLVVVMLGYEACKQIHAWWKGEITGTRCVKNVVDSIGSAAGGVAGGRTRRQGRWCTHRWTNRLHHRHGTGRYCGESCGRLPSRSPHTGSL